MRLQGDQVEILAKQEADGIIQAEAVGGAEVLRLLRDLEPRVAGKADR